MALPALMLLLLLPRPTGGSAAGRFVGLQPFGTPRTGGYGLEAFAIDGRSFLALAQFFGNQSTIYRWNGTGFVLHQRLPSHAGHAFRHLTVDGQHFLALANYRTGFTPGDPNGWPQGPWFWPPKQTNSTVWRYDSSSRRFVEFQSLATSGANAWTAFSVGGRSYLAVANSHTLGTGSYTGDVNSTVYRYDSEVASFTPVQQIATHSALDIESFTIGNATYLAVANTESKQAGFLVESPVLRWSEQRGQFEQIQLLNTTAATGITFFTVPGARGGHFLAVANRYGKTGHRENSMIYRWQQQQVRFVPFQLVPTKGAYDWEFFTVVGSRARTTGGAGDGRAPMAQTKPPLQPPQPQLQQQHFLAVANHWDEKAPDPKHPIAINSTVYTWDDASRTFVMYQQLPTIGAEQIRHLTVPRTMPTEVSASGGGRVRRQRTGVGTRDLLAVAQCVDDASGWNTTSKIWEFVS